MKAAPDSIIRLCETFATHSDHYRSAAYNETQLRREFLDPLFKALGWDIDNEQGYANAYKDVIHEDAIKIGGRTKAPDYCFRIGGQRKFFLEAKKPAIDIHEDSNAAYQLRRYAWSAKMPLSILSDFEALSVYDCRIPPRLGDKASTARTLYFTYDQYGERWDEIAGIFSREAVLKGVFDKYAEASRKKRGTAEVDDAFLEEIERWRDLLARDFALRNHELSARDLNFAVQTTIDRIVFLRICEDRGTEEYGRLQALIGSKETYQRLMDVFRAADARYNSGLFHFEQEKGRSEAPDRLTPGLKLADRVLKDILKNLYYPESPYEFAEIPADILGQVYERFLGKIIRLTAGHQARIEDRPEVRKAGGVYYTPKYIVDHIVENSLGRLLNGPDPQTPRPMPVTQAAKLKVVDPACGSGSFLIVAYQYLLDWHRDQYSLDPETQEPDKAKIKRHASGKTPKIYQAPGGEWKLTTAERKRILINNIHGVDIDSQAVEVTKLSLLLKVLEGETQQVIQRNFIAERERILPDLGHNIRCGNSLIGPDFYEQPNLPELDDEAHYRINAFNWRAAFPEVFAQGGFDCVIGNPPYIFTRELISAAERNYYATRYALSWEKHNTFMLFMESMLRLLRPEGRGSFIVPNSWLTIESARLLREAFIPRLIQVIDLNYLAFQRVSMEPSIFVIGGAPERRPVATLRVESAAAFKTQIPSGMDRNKWIADGRVTIAASADLATLLERISATSSTVGAAFDVRTGLQAYEEGKGTPPQTARDVKDHVFDCWEKADASAIKYLAGRDVARYQLGWSGMWMRYGPWLAQPRDLGMFTRRRVLIREITAPLPYCIHAVYTDKRYLSNKSVLTVLDHGDDH
jgi:hypothetical protein